MSIGRLGAGDTAIQPTIFDAKADLLTATAADTPARLAVGNDGETLVADSSATTGLRYTAGTVQNNPVLNSSFQLWQRGTSVSLVASTPGYTADRWYVVNGANQATTVSRQVTNDTTNLPFIQYCARVQRNSGQTGTGTMSISQPFETINSIAFAGKTVTMSFYARKGANYSATSDVLTVYLITGTGTDQNQQGAGYTGQTLAINQSATLTTTWQRFKQSVTLGTGITEIQPVLTYTPTGTAGANDYFEVTGVQIDIGSVALPFRTNGGTLQEELAACQRYYYRTSTPNAGNGYVSPAGVAATTGRFDTSLNAPVTMRAVPSSIDYSALQVRTAGGSAKTITAVVLDAASASNVQTRWSAATFTLYEIAFLETTSTSGYWALSAEL